MLRAWIQRIARWQDAPSFEPHLTLLGSSPDPETTAVAIDRAISSLWQMPIELQELADTSEYFRCIVLVAKRTREFDAFRSALVADLDPTGTQDPYWPHLSLLYAVLGPTERAALRERVTIEVPLRIVISDLWLVDTSGPDPSAWTRMNTWSLPPAG